MFLLALIPTVIALGMLLLVMYAFFMMYSRRDSIKLILDLRNKEIFESYGIKMAPSNDYEWIVAEIKNSKPGMVTKNLKIGGKKEDQKDTSQGLLGNLNNVDFD